MKARVLFGFCAFDATHPLGGAVDVGWIKRSVSTRIDGLLNLGGNAALFPPYDFWFQLVRLRLTRMNGD
jgi:hypothetical protein